MSPYRFLAIALLGLAWPGSGHGQVPSAAEQVAAAVLPLPEALQSGAGVRGYSPSLELVTLRPSSNGMVCTADRPNDDQFDVRCYNAEFLTIIDFYRRLVREGVSDSLADLRLKEEVGAGRLRMPDHPTAGYRMLGPIAAFDARTNSALGTIEKWQSVHFPYRTAEEVGFPITEEGTMPFVMSSGTWWSHVMIVHPPAK